MCLHGAPRHDHCVLVLARRSYLWWRYGAWSETGDRSQRKKRQILWSYWGKEINDGFFVTLLPVYRYYEKRFWWLSERFVFFRSFCELVKTNVKTITKRRQWDVDSFCVVWPSILKLDGPELRGNTLFEDWICMYHIYKQRRDECSINPASEYEV